MCLDSDKVFFMFSNFSVIPIRWVLTVNSEVSFFLSIHSLRVCLLSFKTRAVQQKIYNGLGSTYPEGITCIQLSIDI